MEISDRYATNKPEEETFRSVVFIIVNLCVVFILPLYFLSFFDLRHLITTEYLQTFLTERLG
jgi:hypothetical protein